MASRSAQTKRTSRVILIIASLLVLTSLGYFAYQYFWEREENRGLVKKVDDLNEEVFELESRIYEFEVLLDDQKLDLLDKTNELNRRKRDLEALAAQLQEARNKNQGNQEEITQLEQRVERLMRLIDQYEEEITVLEQTNEALSGEVNYLQDSQSELLEENQSLLQTKDQALQELHQTQELAAVLKTRDFTFFNVRRNREIQDSVFRRWGLLDLRVCVTLIENPLAPTGTTEVYLVYEGPTGEIYQPEDGGGTFEYGGQLREYTALERIDYQQTSEEVCFEFRPGDDFRYEKGPQYVSIFANGNLIGQSSFRVK